MLLSPRELIATTLKSTQKNHCWENKLKITPKEAVPSQKQFFGGRGSKEPLLLFWGH